MKNKNLKISIVTPSYNQGEFIGDTIKSIVNQNYPNLEYIIYDACSTDNSVDIIKEHEDKITFWKCEKDKGQSDAINKGLIKATGEIFAWQNSDDNYLPDTFSFVNKVFSENPNIDLLFGGWRFIDDYGKTISERTLRNYSLKKLHSGAVIPPQPAVFFRKNAIERVGGIDLERPHAMDYDLYLKIAREENLYITKRILGEFRIQINSKTVSQKMDQFNDMRFVRKRYFHTHKCSSSRLSIFYFDQKELLKDFIHKKTGVFSLKDIFKMKKNF